MTACPAPFCGRYVGRGWIMRGFRSPAGGFFSDARKAFFESSDRFDILICGSDACKEWGRLRIEELENGMHWQTHLYHAGRTSFTPELPEDMRRERLAVKIRELQDTFEATIQGKIDNAAHDIERMQAKKFLKKIASNRRGRGL